MRSQKGFTLTELLIVIAIIGILTSVALPAYQDYVVRGKIPDATSNLAAKRIAMEQYFQDNRSYYLADAAVPFGLPCASDTTTSQYFNFACIPSPLPANALAYTITATGKGSMTGFTYTIDQNNTKQTTTVPAGWTSSLNCWITKKGGVC